MKEKTDLWINTIYPNNKNSEEGFINFCGQLQLADEEKKDPRFLEQLQHIYEEASVISYYKGYIAGRLLVDRTQEFNSKTGSKICISVFYTFDNNENYNEKNMNRTCCKYELFIDKKNNLVSTKKNISAFAKQGEDISYSLTQSAELIDQSGKVMERVKAGTYTDVSKDELNVYLNKMPYFNNVENYGVSAFDSLDRSLDTFYPDMSIIYDSKYSNIYLNHQNRGVGKGWAYTETRNSDGITATIKNHFYDDYGKEVPISIEDVPINLSSGDKRMRIDKKIITTSSGIEAKIAESNQRLHRF